MARAHPQPTAAGQKQVLVIGAGLGGLSAAIRLAAAGFRVTVLEQQERPGGKLQRIEAGGYRFDRGPSTITMLHRFREVFATAGRRMEDYIQTYPLAPAARNIFADGTQVDLSSSAETMEEQMAAYSPHDAKAYRLFLEEAKRLYELSEQHFLNKLLLGWRDKLNPNLAAAFMSIRPFTPMNKLLARYFRHPHTLAMFGRYATYVGSSPYEAPALFAMLAHVEGSLGIYGVKGGTYEIVSAFARLAAELGVELRTGTAVRRIVVRGGRAVAVETDDATYAPDLVLANRDVLEVYGSLLEESARPSMPQRRLERYEPSLSGFVQLLGVSRRYDRLLHHTVFFPERYEEEFEAIFKLKQPPREPTLYICNPAASLEPVAPAGGSSLFVLANAPYLSESWDWEEQAGSYRELVLQRLQRLGLEGVNEAEVSLTYTPLQLHRDTGAYKGAIYGISSNTPAQTFLRPSNRSRDIDNLWFVGGTTHPGGGTPIVVQSGQLVAERMIELYQ